MVIRKGMAAAKSSTKTSSGVNHVYNSDTLEESDISGEKKVVVNAKLMMMIKWILQKALHCYSGGREYGRDLAV